MREAGRSDSSIARSLTRWTGYNSTEVHSRNARVRLAVIEGGKYDGMEMLIVETATMYHMIDPQTGLSVSDGYEQQPSRRVMRRGI